MKLTLILSFLSVFIILYYYYFYVRSTNIIKKLIYHLTLENPKEIKEDKFPKILHLMYFPWESKTGILKDNEKDFNYKCYNNLKNKNKDWEIKLWTLNKTKEFANKHYPEYNKLWDLIKHPVQAVDFYRLLVTYHYGGIYWQYDSIQKTNLNCFVPPKEKEIRLFLECIINKPFSLKIAKEKIRENKPEEELRIATQCFSSYEKSDFLKYSLEKSWKNLHNLKLVNQYDILYIGGNAMFSEAYDEYKEKNNITLTLNTNKYIDFSSKSSWRLDSY